MGIILLNIAEILPRIKIPVENNILHNYFGESINIKPLRDLGYVFS